MRRSVWNVVGLVAPIVFVVGCGDKKTEIPSKLDQPIPKAVSSGGGGGGAGPGQTGGDKKGDSKKAQPATSAD